MIRVLTNRRIFEYDIHSLIKAFYPGEEIRPPNKGGAAGLHVPGIVLFHGDGRQADVPDI